ncbi:MAG: ATP-grasp domain-containing protein [Dehalococcoidales bacterium]|nr:ATP-grasp domain-containing protein [Dehalococcoidales bacterium]
MRIGLAYDLKEDMPVREGQPEDALVEYDSRKTIEIIETSIRNGGHSVLRLGGGRTFLNNILQENVDMVFNIAEGRGPYRSREAQVPSVLELLGIPYSGSDPQCLAICLDKPLTKQLVAAAGVYIPKEWLIADSRELKDILQSKLPFPLIIKPVYEGSSKGIHSGSVVENTSQMAEIAAKLLESYHQPVMAEEFIKGDEITVGVVGNAPPRILGIMRILPRERTDCFVYSVQVKRDWEKLVDYECPARLKKGVLEEISSASLKAFKVLGCRDFARLDFRVNTDGIPYFLEINPLPGLGDYSDLVIMAIKMGWSHEALITAVLNAALERYPLCVHR